MLLLLQQDLANIFGDSIFGERLALLHSLLETEQPRCQQMMISGGAWVAARLLLISLSWRDQGGETVLYTLVVVLLILWLLGMLSGYTIGAFIHVLLVIALVLPLVQIITGRRPAL